MSFLSTLKNTRDDVKSFVNPKASGVEDEKGEVIAPVYHGYTDKVKKNGEQGSLESSKENNNVFVDKVSGLWNGVRNLAQGGFMMLVNTIAGAPGDRAQTVNSLSYQYDKELGAYAQAYERGETEKMEEAKKNMEELDKRISNEFYADGYGFYDDWKKNGYKNNDNLANIVAVNRYGTLNSYGTFTEYMDMDTLKNELGLNGFTPDENGQFPINAATVKIARQLGEKLRTLDNQAEYAGLSKAEQKEQTEIESLIQEEKDKIIDKITKEGKAKDMQLSNGDTLVKLSKNQLPFIIDNFISDDIRASYFNNLKIINLYEDLYREDMNNPVLYNKYIQKIYNTAINNIEKLNDDMVYIYDHFEEYDGNIYDIQSRWYRDHGADSFMFDTTDDSRKDYVNMEDWAISAYDTMRLAQSREDAKASLPEYFGGDSKSGNALKSIAPMTRFVLNGIGLGWSEVVNLGQGGFNYIMPGIEATVQDNDDGYFKGKSQNQIFDELIGVDYGMTSLDIIRSQLVNDNSKTSAFRHAVFQGGDAAPDMIVNLKLVDVMNKFAEVEVPTTAELLKHPEKYAKFNSLNAELNNLSVSQYYTYKFAEFVNKGIALNIFQGAAVQGEFVEDYTSVDFALDCLFTVFDVAEVLKSAKGGRMALGQATRNAVWHGAVQRLLDVPDSKWNLLTLEQKNAMAEYFRKEVTKGLSEMTNKNGYTIDETIDAFLDVYNKVDGRDIEGLKRWFNSDVEFADDYFLKKIIAAGFEEKSKFGKMKSDLIGYTKSIFKVGNDLTPEKVIANLNLPKEFEGLRKKIGFKAIPDPDSGGTKYIYYWKDELTEADREAINNIRLDEFQVKVADNISTEKIDTNDLYSFAGGREIAEAAGLGKIDGLTIDGKVVSEAEYRKNVESKMKEEKKMLSQYIKDQKEIELFMQREYSVYGDGSYMGDVDYRFISSNDPKKEFNKRYQIYVENKAKRMEEERNAAKKNGEMPNEKGVYFEYNNNRYADINKADAALGSEAVGGKPNLVGRTYEEVMSLNKSFTDAEGSKTFFYRVVNSNLSIQEKNQILYSFSNHYASDGEFRFTISSKNNNGVWNTSGNNWHHLFGSKLEQEQFLGYNDKYSGKSGNGTLTTYNRNGVEEQEIPVKYKVVEVGNDTQKVYITSGLSGSDGNVRGVNIELEFRNGSFIPTKIEGPIGGEGISFAPSRNFGLERATYFDSNLKRNVGKKPVFKSWRSGKDTVENPIFKNAPVYKNRMQVLKDIVEGEHGYLLSTSIKSADGNPINIDGYQNACRVLGKQIPYTLFDDIQNKFKNGEINGDEGARLLNAVALSNVQEKDRVFYLPTNAQAPQFVKDVILPFENKNAEFMPVVGVGFTQSLGMDSKWISPENNMVWYGIDGWNEDKTVYYISNKMYGHELQIHWQPGGHFKVVNPKDGTYRITEIVIPKKGMDMSAIQNGKDIKSNQRLLDEDLKDYMYRLNKIQSEGQYTGKTWGDKYLEGNVDKSVKEGDRYIASGISYLKEHDINDGFISTGTFKDFVEQKLFGLMYGDGRFLNPKGLYGSQKLYDKIISQGLFDGLAPGQQEILDILNQNKAGGIFVIDPSRGNIKVNYGDKKILFEIDGRKVTVNVDSDMAVVSVGDDQYLTMLYRGTYKDPKTLDEEDFMIPVGVKLDRSVSIQPNMSKNPLTVDSVKYESDFKMVEEMNAWKPDVDDAYSLYNYYKRHFEGIDFDGMSLDEALAKMEDIAKNDKYVQINIKAFKIPEEKINKTLLFKLYAEGKEFKGVYDSFDFPQKEEGLDFEACAELYTSLKGSATDSSMGVPYMLDDGAREYEHEAIMNSVVTAFNIQNGIAPAITMKRYSEVQDQLNKVRLTDFDFRYKNGEFEKGLDLNTAAGYKEYVDRVSNAYKAAIAPITLDDLGSKMYLQQITKKYKNYSDMGILADHESIINTIAFTNDVAKSLNDAVDTLLLDKKLVDSGQTKPVRYNFVDIEKTKVNVLNRLERLNKSKRSFKDLQDFYEHYWNYTKGGKPGEWYLSKMVSDKNNSASWIITGDLLIISDVIGIDETLRLISQMQEALLNSKRFALIDDLMASSEDKIKELGITENDKRLLNISEDRKNRTNEQIVQIKSLLSDVKNRQESIFNKDISEIFSEDFIMEIGKLGSNEMGEVKKLLMNVISKDENLKGLSDVDLFYIAQKFRIYGDANPQIGRLLQHGYILIGMGLDKISRSANFHEMKKGFNVNVYNLFEDLTNQGYLPYEIGVFTDKQGNVLNTVLGSAGNYSYHGYDTTGKIIWHNHPNSSFFSAADLRTSGEDGLGMILPGGISLLFDTKRVFDVSKNDFLQTLRMGDNFESMSIMSYLYISHELGLQYQQERGLYKAIIDKIEGPLKKQFDDFSTIIREAGEKIEAEKDPIKKARLNRYYYEQYMEFEKRNPEFIKTIKELQQKFNEISTNNFNDLGIRNATFLKPQMPTEVAKEIVVKVKKEKIEIKVAKGKEKIKYVEPDLNAKIDDVKKDRELEAKANGYDEAQKNIEDAQKGLKKLQTELEAAEKELDNAMKGYGISGDYKDAYDDGEITTSQYKALSAMQTKIDNYKRAIDDQNQKIKDAKTEASWVKPKVVTQTEKRHIEKDLITSTLDSDISSLVEFVNKKQDNVLNKVQGFNKENPDFSMYNNRYAKAPIQFLKHREGINLITTALYYGADLGPSVIENLEKAYGIVVRGRTKQAVFDDLRFIVEHKYPSTFKLGTDGKIYSNINPTSNSTMFGKNYADLNQLDTRSNPYQMYYKRVFDQGETLGHAGILSDEEYNFFERRFKGLYSKASPGGKILTVPLANKYIINSDSAFLKKFKEMNDAMKLNGTVPEWIGELRGLQKVSEGDWALKNDLMKFYSKEQGYYSFDKLGYNPSGDLKKDIKAIDDSGSEVIYIFGDDELYNYKLADKLEESGRYTIQKGEGRLTITKNLTRDINGEEIRPSKKSFVTMQSLNCI